MKWKISEEKEEEAATHRNSVVVCVSSKKKTGYICYKCKSSVSVGSPAFRRKNIKKICSKCFFERYEKGKNKKDKIIVTKETLERAARETAVRVEGFAG